MGILLEESRRRLQAQGGRMTAQRRMILEILEEMSGHPTAEEIFEKVCQQDASIHLSTVYRTLRWLESEGLVNARVFDEEGRQERFDASHPAEHYHFMCTCCKSVIEFDTLLVNTIKAQFELHSGAEVESGTVILYGLCAKCRQAEHASWAEHRAVHSDSR